MSCPRPCGPFSFKISPKAKFPTKEQNLDFDAINDNLPEIIELYGNNSRKITCDYYIDDRMLLPEAVKA